MQSPLFHGSRILCVLMLVTAAAAAHADHRPGQEPADAAQADAAQQPAGFRFARGLAAPAEAADRQKDGVELRRVLTTMNATEAGDAAPRRERPYGGACNFTTSCR